MNSSSLSVLSSQEPDRLFILPIGGCGEFGMNLTVYAYRGRSYIVDCGLAFAEPFEIGIDAHIPSPELLEELLGGTPEAFLITHGHEDHLGALPFFMARWDVPIFIGPWARDLLIDKLQQRNDSHPYKIHEVKAGQQIVVGDLQVDWFHVPHSIPFCCSLVIQAGKHRVVHTGDFKTQGYLPFDPSLLPSTLEAIRKKGPILALVADSTNAHVGGYCPSESTVIPELTQVLESIRGISYLSTFSSNLWRIKTILNIAQKLDKRVFVFGTGMRKSLELGVKLKLLSDEVRVLIDEEGLKSIERDRLVVICTGCQGEYRSGLRRIVEDEINFLKVMETDQVIFSSRVIPGNEKSIAKMISLCHLKKARVVTAREKPGIHVSGHAHIEDLKMFLRELKPRYHIPVHGTFTQMRANQDLADENEVISIRNGLLISLDDKGVREHDEYQLERLFVDSWSRQSMSYATMRERHKIGDSGMAIASGVVSSKRTIFDIEFIGLPFSDDDASEDCRAHLCQQLQRLYERTKDKNEETYNEQARLLVRKVLTDRFIKKPVVVSKITLLQET